MPQLTNIEKGAFLRLFNDGGYVLDFSTNDFDNFTLDSVGVALCHHYGLSKGKSLTAYANEAEASKVVKLFTDLLAHFEIHCTSRCERDEDIAKLYARCRAIIDRFSNVAVPLAGSAHTVAKKFSSDYMSAQIKLMLEMTTQNPTEAIGKAKEFAESCCRTILEAHSVSIDKIWDMGKLVGETVKLLCLTPQDIPDTSKEAAAIRRLLGNLREIVSNMATIRNSYGSGHGKSANYRGLEKRHAQLAVGSSITLVQFLWDSHETQSQRR
ncbi:MAG TPA: abortive infection family protein [Kiritimatiellia bacterium]|jgi:hypothetical protein|nr:MAG: hypothetical protein BWX54_00674 [Verrucomicrobia bacterium ADurb.Bin018]HOD99749.1 abortive infection family protein [Kiritimatiellia bacterium]HOE36181.1 abortive infection family protein [Kiritimatiellia bacterium]HOR73815.1 abortive infection family protein [Kiritimatiellia bacterium]HOU58151.1 abortive infection family protein [Kiritimatiellia bacterium]